MHLFQELGENDVSVFLINKTLAGETEKLHYKSKTFLWYENGHGIFLTAYTALSGLLTNASSSSSCGDVGPGLPSGDSFCIEAIRPAASESSGYDALNFGFFEDMSSQGE